MPFAKKILCLVGGLCAVSIFAAPPAYQLTDLGIPHGYDESIGIGINNSGQVAGNAIDSDGGEHAFIYSDGNFTILPLPNGYVKSRAVAINNNGDITGIIFDNSGGFHAFLYTGGVVQDLPSVQSLAQSAADGLNDSGQVVGWSDIITPSISVNASIFPSTDLGIKSGYDSSEAYAINNSGQIVLGETQGFSTNEIFLDTNGTLVDTGINGAGGEPYCINDAGEFTGTLANSGDPFLYANGTVTDLSTMGLSSESTIYGFNNAGQMVGSNGFVYYNGTQYFFNSLTISGGSGWNYSNGQGINDSGQIVGSGYPPNSGGNQHAFILSPNTPVTAGKAPNPPVVSKQPSNAIIVSGKTAKFSVTATGTAPFTYQWQVSSDGGTTWGNVTANSTVKGTTSATLTITNADVGLSGDKYQCIINNASNTTATSNIVTLAVGIPAKITSAPQNLSKALNQTATFTVGVSGTPTPDIQWYKGTSILIGKTDPTLSLPNIESGDAASYTVTVSNSFGSATAKASLKIILAPNISQQPAAATVVLGKAAKFTVKATGTAPLTYQWQLSTNNGNNWANITKATASTYTIAATAFGDNHHQFRCLVNNATGLTATSDSALLTVGSPPKILSSLANQTVATGASPNFSVVLTGSTPYTIQWFQGTTLLDDQTSTTLLLSNVQVANAGIYTIKVTNIYGTATAKATLKVKP